MSWEQGTPLAGCREFRGRQEREALHPLATRKAGENHAALVAIPSPGTRTGACVMQDLGLAPINLTVQMKRTCKATQPGKGRKSHEGAKAEREQGPRIKGSFREASSSGMEPSAWANESEEHKEETVKKQHQGLQRELADRKTGSENPNRPLRV